MKTGCRIVKDIKRPEKTLVDQFAGVAVANLDDCMGRISAVHEDIVPVNKTRLLGTAFTVDVYKRQVQERCIPGFHNWMGRCRH